MEGPDTLYLATSERDRTEFNTTSYHVQAGALNAKVCKNAYPFSLFCFSDTITGALRQPYFLILLPDGTGVEPLVTRRPSAAYREQKIHRSQLFLDSGPSWVIRSQTARNRYC